MKLRWMASGLVRVASSASNKWPETERRIKGRKPVGLLVWGAQQWECKWGEGDAQPWRRERSRERGRECVREMEEARNWEREKNGSVEVIYASCIIFYNAALPFPYGSPFPPPYPILPPGCAPPHCHTKNSPWPHQPVIKILPWCDCSTSQMEDWT